MAAAFVAVTAARALRGAVPAAACRRRGGGSAAAASTAPAAFRWGVERATMASEAAPEADASLEDLVQYVVVRADLAAPPHEWPAGALMAQAVHAALAAAVAYASHPATAAYTAQTGGAYRPGALTAAAATAAGQPADAPQMHTVVLSAKSETVLENLAAKLAAVPLDFVLWREQPEGVATALATRPYPRANVRQHFRKLRLFSTPTPAPVETPEAVPKT